MIEVEYLKQFLDNPNLEVSDYSLTFTFKRSKVSISLDENEEITIMENLIDGSGRKIFGCLSYSNSYCSSEELLRRFQEYLDSGCDCTFYSWYENHYVIRES